MHSQTYLLLIERQKQIEHINEMTRKLECLLSSLEERYGQHMQSLQDADTKPLPSPSTVEQDAEDCINNQPVVLFDGVI